MNKFRERTSDEKLEVQSQTMSLLVSYLLVRHTCLLPRRRRTPKATNPLLHVLNNRERTCKEAAPNYAQASHVNMQIENTEQHNHEEFPKKDEGLLRLPFPEPEHHTLGMWPAGRVYLKLVFPAGRTVWQNHFPPKREKNTFSTNTNKYSKFTIIVISDYKNREQRQFGPVWWTEQGSKKN